MLSDEPRLSGPSITYQIAIFIIIQVWAIMTFETAQFQLLLLFEAPWNWILWTMVLMATLAPVVYAVVWKAKQQVRFGSLKWDFRNRDVTLNEFKEMTKQYADHYQYMISRIDYLFLSLSIVAGIALVLSPFPLLRTTALVISLTPTLCGLIMMVFGVLLSVTLFRAVPSSVSDEFPHHSYRVQGRALSRLADLPGTSWVGIRLALGESQGLYTIRSPRPVVRVEDIEGVARIECEIDRTGHIQSAKAILEDIDGNEESIGSLDSDVSRLGLTKLVKNLLVAYIAERGDDAGILGEIVEEVDHAVYSMTQEE